MDPTFGHAPKKYASRFYQLKVGHTAVGTFLARIGAIETPECWWCGEAEQSVVHLYTRCRRWRKERRKMIREVHNRRCNMAGADREKVACRSTGQPKSYKNVIKISTSDGNWR